MFTGIPKGAVCVYRMPGAAITTARYLARRLGRGGNAGQSGDTWTSKGNCCPGPAETDHWQTVGQDTSHHVQDLGDVSARARSQPPRRLALHRHDPVHAVGQQQISFERRARDENGERRLLAYRKRRGRARETKRKLAKVREVDERVTIDLSLEEND